MSVYRIRGAYVYHIVGMRPRGWITSKCIAANCLAFYHCSLRQSANRLVIAERVHPWYTTETISLNSTRLKHPDC